MKEKLRVHRPNLLILMILLFVVGCFSGQDAIHSTILYNQLDLKKPIDFRIDKKYNKKDGKYFPDLNFGGVNQKSSKYNEVKVSKGDFDKHEIGQIIKVYKTKSNKFMTQHEIKNQKIFHVGEMDFSFMFLPSALFILIGVLLFKIIFKN